MRRRLWALGLTLATAAFFAPWDQLASTLGIAAFVVLVIAITETTTPDEDAASIARHDQVRFDLERARRLHPSTCAAGDWPEPADGIERRAS